MAVPDAVWSDAPDGQREQHARDPPSDDDVQAVALAVVKAVLRIVDRTDSGKVRYRLRKPYYTGQTELVLDPEAFLRRLAALVPPPRQHQVRYYGLLASQARDRDRLCALVVPPDGHAPSPASHDADPPDPVPAWRAARRIRWAKLLARVFDLDVLLCPACRAPRSIIAALTDPAAIRSVLAHLHLPTEPPRPAPARAPPQLDWLDDPCPGA